MGDWAAKKFEGRRLFSLRNTVNETIRYLSVSKWSAGLLFISWTSVQRIKIQKTDRVLNHPGPSSKCLHKPTEPKPMLSWFRQAVKSQKFYNYLGYI